MTRKTKITEQPKLSKAQWFEMRNYHLQHDLLKKDLQAVELSLKNFDQAKTLATLRRNDVKAKIARLQQENDKFMDRLEKELGTTVRNKTINPESYEISD